jgi:hypothetical protein
VDARDIAYQLSLGRITPTTPFERRHNLVFCAVTPKCASLAPTIQTATNNPLDHPGLGGAGFRT